MQTIVIATDGSELSAKAIEPGLKLAKPLGARVVVVRVTEPVTLRYIEGIVIPYPEEEVEKLIAEKIELQFGRIRQMAADERVEIETRHVRHMQPWQGILDVATEVDADLIIMASHGHGGIGSILLGSQTLKLLSNSTIPILVYR